MEQNNNSKNYKKALWILSGISIVLVSVLIGLLIYNQYVDNKECANTYTKESDQNNSSSNIDKDSDVIDLTYEIDINEQNIYPIYYKFENKSYTYLFDEENALPGEFVIDSNTLYFEMNGVREKINISNPRKVVICDYGLGVETITVCVLNTLGKVYEFESGKYQHSFEYIIDKNTNIVNISGLVEEMNNTIRYSELSDIDDISAFLINRKCNNDLNIFDRAGEDLVFTITKDDKDMYYYPSSNITKNISELILDLGPVYVKSDKTVYDYEGNKLNIKPKYLLEYNYETGHGAFLDEDNYLYVSTYEKNKNMNKGKVTNVYESIEGDLVIKFENGTYKKLSEYHNW